MVFFEYLSAVYPAKGASSDRGKMLQIKLIAKLAADPVNANTYKLMPNA
jgi:hypothetical protein